MKKLIIYTLFALACNNVLAQQNDKPCWHTNVVNRLSNDKVNEQVYLINNIVLSEARFHYLREQTTAKLKKLLNPKKASKVQSAALQQIIKNSLPVNYFNVDILILQDGAPLENRMALLDYYNNDFCQIIYLPKYEVKKRFKMKVGKDLINILK